MNEIDLRNHKQFAGRPVYRSPARIAKLAAGRGAEGVSIEEEFCCLASGEPLECKDESLFGLIGFTEVYEWAEEHLLPIIRARFHDPLSRDIYGGATYNPHQRWLDPEHKYRHLMTVLASVTGADTEVTFDFTRLLEVAVIMLIRNYFLAVSVFQALLSIYKIYPCIYPSIHPSIYLSIYLS